MTTLMDGVEDVGTIQDQVRDFANSFNAHVLVLIFHQLLQVASCEGHLDRCHC